MSTREDRHNNPIACTTEIAAQGKLILGEEYSIGDPFTAGAQTFHTARFLKDPIALSIKIIDNIGYYTKWGGNRWTYIAMPKFVWDSLTFELKKEVIAFHYKNEGGTELKGLFT